MILTTGTAGFIGGNFLHYLHKQNPHSQVVCVDNLTYAANYDYIKPLIECGFVIFRKCDKIKNELGYIPEYTIESGLRKTIDWIKNGK